MTRLRIAVLVSSLLSLAACGGGGSGGAAPPAQALPAQKSGPAQAQIRVVVPANSSTASALRRHALFVAFNTAGVTIAAYTSPHAQNPTAVAQSSFDISATSANCTATANGGRTCTLAFALPSATTDDFVVTTYDTAPVSGAIPATAKQLGIGVTPGVALTSGTNTVAFSINGVVASATVLLSGPPIVAVNAATQNVNVQALDAAQNTIVTDAYSDAQGNPVTIALGVSGTSSAHFQVTPASISVPAPNGITLTYTPAGMTAAEFANGFGATVAATPSNSGSTASSTSVTVPVGNQLFTTGFTPLPGSQSPFGMTLGPDNNIWFTDNSIPGYVGKISETGTVREIPTLTSTSMGFITVGSDNKLWFAEGSADNIGNVDPVTQTVTEFPVTTANSFPLGICAGPDGNLWFAESSSSKIGRITTAGVVTEFALAVGSTPIAITAGPDGALWFTESGANKIGRITTGGVITQFAIPTPSVDPVGIAVGPDGALWFAENASISGIGRITTGGTFSQFDISPAQFTNYVVSGPDGNVWATTNGDVLRITTSGAVTIFPIAVSQTEAFAVGHDGNLWYGLAATGIGKIVL